jgi:hypothetical protein
MNWELIIGKNGYFALLVATFLEVETILILAGFAAHLGYLSLPWVNLVALIGTLSGDQLFFYLGRRNSQFILDRHPVWQGRLDRVQRLFELYQTFLKKSKTGPFLACLAFCHLNNSFTRLMCFIVSKNLLLRLRALFFKNCFSTSGIFSRDVQKLFSIRTR